MTTLTTTLLINDRQLVVEYQPVRGEYGQIDIISVEERGVEIDPVEEMLETEIDEACWADYISNRQTAEYDHDY